MLVACRIKPIQAQVFQKEKSYATVGYGFIIVPEPIQAQGIEHTAHIKGPFYGKYEYGITDKFGIAINFAYLNFIVNIYHSHYENGRTVEYYSHEDYNGFSGLIRANLHFGSDDRIDPYLGFGMGYRTAKWDYNSHNSIGQMMPKSLMKIIILGLKQQWVLKLCFLK